MPARLSIVCGRMYGASGGMSHQLVAVMLKLCLSYCLCDLRLCIDFLCLCWIRKRARFMSQKIAGMDVHHLAGARIDIDTEEDWREAERFLETGGER